MSKGNKHFYEFGPFRIDPEERQLLRGQDPVPLTPKAFETLLILIRSSEHVVLKDELMKALWPDSFVEDGNLSQNIFILRKALGDSAQDARYIATVPGRGYRFAQKVKQVGAEEDALVIETHSESQVVIKETSPGMISSLTWGDRRIRALGLVLGMAVVLVAGYLAWRASRPAAGSANPRMMLVVLPFQNLTGDPEQEYFADGLTEELITKLGRLHPAQLGVIARTSVMGYKHSDKRLDQIGRELGVQYVLEGSVRRSGDRVRITAQLISVADQSHLWADDYDRKLQDVTGCLIAFQPQHTLQAHGAHPILLASHPPHCPKPKGQRQATVLKNRPRTHRNLVVATGTSYKTVRLRPVLRPATARAAKTVRPPQPKQIFPTGRLGRKAGLQLQQISRIIFHGQKHLQ